MDTTKSENEKDLKIKELEELIEKMKKEHLEELNKIKNKKNLENNFSYKEKEKSDNNNKEMNIIQFNIDNLDQMVKDLFNKQKNEFSNEIKIFKKEILSEMKE